VAIASGGGVATKADGDAEVVTQHLDGDAQTASVTEACRDKIRRSESNPDDSCDEASGGLDDARVQVEGACDDQGGGLVLRHSCALLRQGRHRVCASSERDQHDPHYCARDEPWHAQESATHDVHDVLVASHAHGGHRQPWLSQLDWDNWF